MKKTKIIVKTSSKPYPVYFGSGIVSSTGLFIKKNLPNTRKICILCDKNIPVSLVNKLIRSLNKYNPKIYKLPAIEKTKTFKVANKIIENLLNDNLNRSDCIIAFGGGILGDFSAFVSSVVKRGLKFVNIPTTLLAQVDASIGGKTAINSNQGKNLIGTFYQPEFVLNDLSMLNSLPRREIISGYGEILKHALISDKKFFLWLSKNAKNIINKRNAKHLRFAIMKSCLIKSDIVKRDEREKNLRMILNFGHTFAHGFEGAKNFSKKLNHGEAVLLGMIVASQLSYKKKILPLKDLTLIKDHYVNLKLPIKIKNAFKKNKIKKIISFMKKDKKNLDNKINLILLKRIGKTTKPNSIKISTNELKKFLTTNYA